MKEKIVADAIFVVHAALFPIVLFGWLWPRMWPLYLFVLVAVLASDLAFGYCILSKWEFDLRKKANPSIDYDYTWSSYYTSKIFKHERFSSVFWKRAAFVFLSGSLLINVYFKYFS